MADDPTDRDVPTAENPLVEPGDELLNASAAPGGGARIGEPADEVDDEPRVAPVEVLDDVPAEETDVASVDRGSVEPVAAEPVDGAPVAVESVAVDPVVAEPVGAEPVGAEPVAVAPVVVEPAGTSDVVPVGVDASGALPRGGRRSALGRPLPWAAVIVGILLAGLMTYAYVGAFVDPIDELHGLPIAVVDLDQPVTVGGQTIDVGAEVVAATQARPTAATDAVSWKQYATRDAVVEALQRNELAGALILPADLSQRVGAIGSALGGAPQASVEVIRNPGAGSLQPVVVDTATDTVLAQLNTSVAQRLATTLAALGVQVAPANVTALATPVVATVTDIPALDNHGGRGLPPLYIAVMTMLTGLVGAIAIHTAVGTVAGRERIEVMGREVPVRRLRVRPAPRFWQEAALVGMLALGAALIIPWVAVGLLGAHADRPFLAIPVIALGVLASGWLTLLCVTTFGVAGEVLVVLLTTIFGVPSARGVYPAEALPGFFRFLGTFLPLRYLTDAVRAVFFFDGNDHAGLTTGVIVLWVWALGSLIVGGLVAGAISRREARDRRAAASGAVPVVPVALISELVEAPAG